MRTDRDEVIARCKASGMDDEDARDFADELFASIEAESEAIFNRVKDRARDMPPRDFRVSIEKELRAN